MIGTLAVVFLLLEAYFWVRASREHARLEARYADRELCTMAHPDPRLIFTIKPGHCGANSLGFIDTEHEPKKPAGTYRILVVGDSVAMGQGVAPHMAFPRLLEARLRESVGAVEVISMARSGYSTTQQLVVLEELGLAFEPDLLVWSYVLNDPAHPVYHDGNGELGRYYRNPPLYLIDYVQRKWFEAMEGRRAEGCDERFHLFLHCAYRDEVVENLATLAQIATANALPVLMVVHPVLEGGEPDKEALRAVHNDLASIAGHLQMRVVDMLDYLEEVRPEDYRVTNAEGGLDPWHPNEAGHAQIAAAIATRLAGQPPE